MKKTRKCPKCDNPDIFVVSGYSGAYGSGNNISVGLTIFSDVPVDRYICSRCGYSEEWIRLEDIDKVRSSRHASKSTKELFGALLLLFEF